MQLINDKRCLVLHRSILRSFIVDCWFQLSYIHLVVVIKFVTSAIQAVQYAMIGMLTETVLILGDSVDQPNV